VKNLVSRDNPYQLVTELEYADPGLHLLERLSQRGIARGELLHVAQSLFHDHVPANRMGIASAWIDRRHGKAGSGATPLPDPMPRFDFRFTSLGELAAAHRAELD